jgi:predicted Zn-dependent protease
LTDSLSLHDTTRLARLKRSIAALCAASLLATSILPVHAQSRLPALGDSASDDVAVGAERRLGDRIMRDIRRDPDYLDDPVLLDYLNSLWDPLVAAARSRGDIGAELDTRFAWEAFLVRDKTINAFALPGGFVGVHLGLIGMTTTRDELASVLAHELTHVTQRHIARGMANSSRQSMIGLATMILGVLAAGKSGRPDAGNALITGGQAVAMQGQLNFSRDMEREADRIGFQLMSSAGFAPGGMAAMFEKLDQASRLNDSASFPYLRSHPLNAERIGEARSRLGAAPPVPPSSALGHAAAQGRARVMMDTRVDALRRWQAMDAVRDGGSTADKLSAAYSSALASTLLRDWPRADTALAMALNTVRSNPRSDSTAEREVVLLQSQSMLARGDAPQAIVLLKPYMKDSAEATSRAVMLLNAQAAVAVASDDGGLKRSADQLQTWTTLHAGDSTAWVQLGRTWQQLGQPLRGLRAEAESRVALGDYNGALDRLRAGQKLARSTAKVDFIDASIIDSRIRDIEGLRRTQALEEKQES